MSRDTEFPTQTPPPKRVVEEMPPVPTPNRLERYEEMHAIGAGGTGEVRLVHDRILQRDVAVKLLGEGLVGREAVERSFVREARLSGRLDHPNIVPVHDLGLDEDGRAWFTMKAVSGKTLGTIIRERGAQPPDANFLQMVLDILIKVCNGVAFANTHGVVHCDLKPSNVMVGAFGEVYVMDWGIARTIPGRAEDQGVVAGTPGFMAPEQARGEALRVDGRTDVHGIGAMLYYAMTGRAPYAGATTQDRLAATREGDVMSPETRMPGRRLPPGLCTIAMRAIAKDPADRYSGVDALQEDLKGFLRGGWWFDRRTFPAGAVVIREGDEAHAAYIVTDGRAAVYSGERILRNIGPGEVFGETALLAGGTRTASIVALTELTTMVVSRESLDSEIGRDTWLSLFVRTLALRFRETHEALMAAGKGG